MLDRDDERFETYLKQFSPRMPDALPVSEIRQASHRHFGLVWALAGVVAMVILGVASLRIFNHPVADDSKQSAVKLAPATPPLTMRGANALLATAPSYKAAMDELAFPGKSSPIPKDKQSALAVLSREKIKL